MEDEEEVLKRFGDGFVLVGRRERGGEVSFEVASIQTRNERRKIAMKETREGTKDSPADPASHCSSTYPARQPLPTRAP